MKKHTLAQEAIEAAVEAIEKNGFKLVLPVKFDVTHIATLNTEPPRKEESDINSSLPGVPPAVTMVKVPAQKFPSSTPKTPRRK